VAAMLKGYSLGDRWRPDLTWSDLQKLSWLKKKVR